MARNARRTRPPLSEEERRARMEAHYARLERATAALIDSEQWARVLGAAARLGLGRYSFRNLLMILDQCPQATRVAGFHTWRTLGRQVRRGEKGIAILAPITRRISDEDEKPATDTASGEPTDKDGRKLIACTIAHVFDITQTDPISDEDTDTPAAPDIVPAPLTGPALAAVTGKLAALLAAAGAHPEPVPSEAAPAEQARALLYALARHLSHQTDDPDTGEDAEEDPDDIDEDAESLDEDDTHEHTGQGRRAEVVAEATAYTVAAALGLDTAAHSVAYVARWAGGDVERIKAAGTQVVALAARIMADLDTDEQPDNPPNPTAPAPADADQPSPHGKATAQREPAAFRLHPDGIGTLRVVESTDWTTGRVTYQVRGPRITGAFVIGPDPFAQDQQDKPYPQRMHVQYGEGDRWMQHTNPPIVNGVELTGGAAFEPEKVLNDPRAKAWIVVPRTTGPYTSTAAPDATTAKTAAVVVALVRHLMSRPDLPTLADTVARHLAPRQLTEAAREARDLSAQIQALTAERDAKQNHADQLQEFLNTPPAQVDNQA